MADRATWVKDITTPGRIPVSAWGSFKFSGLPTFTAPVSAPSRNTVCVDNQESTRTTLKNVKGWYPSPYMTGVQAICDVSMTDRAALFTHVFPVSWWNMAKADLRYLMANQPKSNYETISWTIHVSWLVYHMMLASNVYPTLWADSLQFAKNSQWEPPPVGWDMSLPRSTTNPGKPSGYPGDSDGSLYPCWLWYDPGEFWTAGIYGNPKSDWAHKVQPGSMTWWDKQLWWGGLFGISIVVGNATIKSVDNVGLAVNEMPWSGKTIYATYAPKFGSDAAPVPVDKMVDDWANKNGLGVLQARARFFHRGGLPDLAKIYMEANSSSQTRMKRDWVVRAQALINLEYWTLVRGGVTAWKYRTGFPYVRSLATSTATDVILLPTCRQDLKVIYNEFQKSWKQSFIVGPMVKFATWLVNSAKAVFRGDFIGAVRAQVDLQKWGKQYAKQTASAPADPYFFFCTIPPIFLRSAGDAFNAFKDQVAMDETRTITQTGTEALYTLTERNVRALEKTTSVALWDVPAVAAPVAAKPAATTTEVVEKRLYLVQSDPSKRVGELPTSNKIWWGLGSVAALSGFLFWRRK